MFKFFELTKSRLRSKLLSFYFGNQDEILYMKEISRLLDEDCGNLQKELVKLEKEDLFHSVKRGNQRYYFLNKQYPFFNELDSIFAGIGNKSYIAPSSLETQKSFSSERHAQMARAADEKIREQVLSKQKDIGLLEKMEELFSKSEGIRAAFLFGEQVTEIKENGLTDKDVFLCIISSGENYDNLSFNSEIENIKKSHNNKIEYVIYTIEEWEKSISLKKGFIFRIFKNEKFVLLDKDNLLQI